MLLNFGVGQDSRVPWTSRRSNQSILKESPNIQWRNWCWSWNSSTLATWCEELTHCKRPWCWESLKAAGKADDRGWVGWMASPWVWASYRSWWWTRKSGMLQSVGWQSRTRLSDWTELWVWFESVLVSDLGFRPFFLGKLGFPDGSEDKESACNLGDSGLILGSGWSPGEGHGNPFQYSCLENSMDRGACRAHGVANSWTWLRN